MIKYIATQTDMNLVTGAEMKTADGLIQETKGDKLQ